jgi:hypothetical protein
MALTLEFRSRQRAADSTSKSPWPENGGKLMGASSAVDAASSPLPSQYIDTLNDVNVKRYTVESVRERANTTP